VNIRGKIVWVVLPLIVAPLVLTGVASVLTARESVTSVAAGLLQFKAEQLGTYAQGQWNLLVANGLEADATYREASEAAVETFARSLLRSSTELIVAVSGDGSVVLRTGDVPQDEPGRAPLGSLAAAGASGWQTLSLAGVERVAYVNRFTPFGWTVFVTEASATFYRSTERIVLQTGIILGASLLLALLLLLVFADRLTRPMRQVADAMQDIITTGDMSERVETLYGDETGRLGHTFNLMTADLEKSYGLVKRYALRAAVAKEMEEKVRKIFQQYVPAGVIEQSLASSQGKVAPEDRICAVLFSDVRGFTPIAQDLKPNQLEEMLNRYFDPMVEAITNNTGLVDKFMGDGIMGTFGTMERTENDALSAVRAALDMLDALPAFNAEQLKRRLKPFAIGIGIHYAIVTVGNLGTARKMEYTVIGDAVNLASRLEGLTKKFHEPLIISESTERKVKQEFLCRNLGRVAVKGRVGGAFVGSGIYTLRRSLSPAETEAWKVHNDAAALFYDRKFADAWAGFRRVLKLLPADEHAGRFLAKCEQLKKSQPGPDWTGVDEMTEK
jgi:adenylate cyclase